MDGMGSTNVFNARFGKTEEAHLAFTHKITNGASYILHRHGPVDPMLVEQIDVIDAEPLQRPLECDADAREAAVKDAGAATGVRDDAEFRRHNGLVPAPLEGPTEELLVGIGAVGLRSVEEVDTEFNCAVDRGDRLRLVRFAVVVAHSHAA